MMRLAFGAKCGSPGNPPITLWLAAPNRVLGRRLARPTTPRPRAVREKNWRRVIARGCAKGEFVAVISVLTVSKLWHRDSLWFEKPQSLRQVLSDQAPDQLSSRRPRLVLRLGQVLVERFLFAPLATVAAPCSHSMQECGL